MKITPNSTTTDSNFEVIHQTNKRNNSLICRKNGSRFLLDRAIQTRNFNEIKRLLENRELVDAPLRPGGSLAGYTALHLACMYFDEELVRLLVEDYHFDVNAVADDGAQPIHLACMYDDSEATKVLLKAGANVDAELELNLFSKYSPNGEWYNDFGDKITMITFAVLHNKSLIAINLINNNANLEVTSRSNRTLLMYALFADMSIGQLMAKNLKNRDFVNARDNNGLSAIHYILHNQKYLHGRYDSDELGVSVELHKGLAVRSLIECGADIYATKNDNPTTFMLNMAAYRSSNKVLEELLPYYQDITKSKALYYATLPIGDFQTSLDLGSSEDIENELRLLKIRRRRSTALILKDLINRRTFGLPVPEEEKQLMDKLVGKKRHVRKLVHKYEQNFIQRTLKNKVIYYGDQFITLYDFILLVCSGRKLKILVRNQTLMDAFQNFNLKYNDNYQWFNNLLTMRIKKAQKRVELLNELRTIEHLREAIPLSYELVLEMIEYLDNYDLKKFINCFVYN